MTTTFLASLILSALDLAAEAAFTSPYIYNDHADCGLAVVVIPAQKGRKAFLDVLAANHPGINTTKASGGVWITLCGGLRNQSRDVYERACDAFVETITAHGITAHTHSWAD